MDLYQVGSYSTTQMDELPISQFMPIKVYVDKCMAIDQIAKFVLGDFDVLDFSVDELMEIQWHVERELHHDKECSGQVHEITHTKLGESVTVYVMIWKVEFDISIFDIDNKA